MLYNMQPLSPLSIAFVAGATSAFVSFVANVVFYYAVRRREQLRDHHVQDVTERLQTLEEQRIVQLEKTRGDDAVKRGKIYRRIEQELISRRECYETRDKVNQSFANGARRMDLMSAQIGELCSKIDSAKAVVDLIAQHMQIQIGNQTP